MGVCESLSPSTHSQAFCTCISYLLQVWCQVREEEEKDRERRRERERDGEREGGRERGRGRGERER